MKPCGNVTMNTKKKQVILVIMVTDFNTFQKIPTQT